MEKGSWKSKVDMTVGQTSRELMNRKRGEGGGGELKLPSKMDGLKIKSLMGTKKIMRQLGMT